jgi:hypothetical protein
MLLTVLLTKATQFVRKRVINKNVSNSVIDKNFFPIHSQ